MKKKGKKPPRIITPTAATTVTTHNYYKGFDTDSETEPMPNNNNPVDNTVVPAPTTIPDEAYLPKEHSFFDHDEVDSLSDSSMGSSSTDTKSPILTTEEQQMLHAPVHQ